MSIDILNMRRFDENSQAVDVALPVLAVECEAKLPLENELDPYEEATLKLVALGLSSNGIAKTLNATRSLVEGILARLEKKHYAHRERGKPWILTKDAEQYLNGSREERASDESQYGYMFINAIKKEVLPFFYQGDVGQISLFRGTSLPLRLTADGDETLTFEKIEIKDQKLRKAYKSYFKILKTVNTCDEGETTKEEALDIFEDLDSFDEEIDTGEDQGADTSVSDHGKLVKDMLIRALDKEPLKLYLRMRLVIDPTCPGGYRAESPFDFDGLDNRFFLRQMQWLEQAETTKIGEDSMQDFLHREITKLSPNYKTSQKDFRVFMTEHMPLLSLYRTKLSRIYDDMERIYALMQQQNVPSQGKDKLLEQENIVSNLAKYVVEALFNAYFRTMDPAMLGQVQKKALDDVRTYGSVNYKINICRNAKLTDDTLRWVKDNQLISILRRLKGTHGNSISEKFINMLAVKYHIGDTRVDKFLEQGSIGQVYEVISNLNHVRNKVSHDTAERFTFEDYEYYMDNVFHLVNRLLEGLRED